MTSQEKIKVLKEALESIIIQHGGDLTDAQFREYVTRVLAERTLQLIA